MGKEHSTFVDGKYVATSASQTKGYIECPRIWYNQKVLKIKKPTTEAMKLGTSIHEANEHYLKTGEILDNPYKKYVLEAKPFLDKFTSEFSEYRVEQNFSMPTFEGGPAWVGYIDLYGINESLDVKDAVLDHKSTKDFKWCKTPGELAKDVQLNSYAKWLSAERSEVGHLYINTTKPKAHYVSAFVSKQQVDDVWGKSLEAVGEMVKVVKQLGVDPTIDRSEELTPNTKSCDLYGGCFFREKCGIDKVPVTALIRKKKEPMGSLSDILKNKKKDGTTSTAQTIEAGSVPIDYGSFLPPDMPTETALATPTLAEEMEKTEKTEKPKKARKPKEVAVLEVLAPAIPGQDKKVEFFMDREEPVKTPATNRKRLVIYQDCLPIKGEKDFVLFEDWIAPLAKKVADAHGQPDYRMIQFTAKAALALMIRENLDSLPEALVIGSYTAGADVAMEQLIPHATKVVKALRG